MPETNATTATRLGGATFDRTRTFGVEMEAYNCHSATVAAALTAAGVECRVESYNHETRRTWKIVSDGSVRGTNPFELVSPPLKGDEGLAQIETVCRVLRELNVKVNRSTGLHVHHDARGLTVENVKAVVTMWWKYEDVLLYFLAPSRRANLYCAPANPRVGEEGRRFCGYNWNPGRDEVAGWKTALDGVRTMAQIGEDGYFQHNRYAPVNCHAIQKHGTLEFRSHGGTTEFDKIRAWIVLTQWMVIRSRDKGCQVRTRMTGRWAEKAMFFWKAIDWINLDDAQVIAAKNTLNRRFKHFKQEENPVIEALQTYDDRGRLRSTDAAARQEPGEV